VQAYGVGAGLPHLRDDLALIDRIPLFDGDHAIVGIGAEVGLVMLNNE